VAQQKDSTELDWSQVHKPSKAYEQEDIKKEIEKIKSMSPYLDKDENIINEDYIIMRIIISNKVKEWQQANPETVATEPTIIEKKIELKAPEPRKELTQFTLQAPAKYMEYETKNGADSNLYLYSMIVMWNGLESEVATK
jgi:hypothetical protein